MTGLSRPATPQQVTASWLTKALQSTGVIEPHIEVGSVRRESLGGGTGVFGTLARLVVDYTEPNSGPTNMVLKIPTSAPENKQVGLALGLYVREGQYFALMADRTPVNSVGCYYNDMDIANGEFVLVLEEIRDMEVGQQTAGATVPQLEIALRELAKFHAAWWKHPDLAKMDWLPRNDSPANLAVVPEIMRTAMTVVERDWAGVIGQDAVDLGKSLAAQFDTVIKKTGEVAHTMCHGDARLENMFFNGDASRMKFIDFQLVIHASPAQDVAYLMGSSCDNDVWDQHGMRLLKLYYDALIAAGVGDYSWDQFWYEFRLNALWAVAAPASMVGTFDVGDDNGKILAHKWMERGWYIPMATNAREVL
jgi:thiamine kinase-like enzyme